MKSAPTWSQLQARKKARSRQAQLALAMDRPVSGILHLRPNGDHWVRVDLNGVTILIHIAQMARLEALFAEVRAEVEADSHRGHDRLHISMHRLGAH